MFHIDGRWGRLDCTVSLKISRWVARTHFRGETVPHRRQSHMVNELFSNTQPEIFAQRCQLKTKCLCLPHALPRVRRRSLATHPTFLKLMSTTTYSRSFNVVELVHLVDEEELDLQDVLYGGPRLKTPEGHLHVLRYFVIINGKTRNRPAWCLLGMDSIRMFFCPNKDHLLSREPQPRCW